MPIDVKNPPIFDVTYTGYNGVAVTLLRAPKGKWIADLASGTVSIGPMKWSSLVRNVEFNLNPQNIHRTLRAQP